MTVMPLILLGLIGAEQRTIDDFNYADEAAARQVWTAGEGTPPVTVVRDGRRSVVAMAAPFAESGLPRVYVDRRVELNLSVPGEFALEITADRPEATAHLTLYFRSGDGWYGANAHLSSTEWQTIRFSKASFRIEGRPTGWHKIDGIRIAAWRGQATDATIRLGRLATKWHDVALVVPDVSARPDDGELKSATIVADRLADMLDELGLGADAVDEAAVVSGALGDRRLAVLAYNPRLSSEATAALAQFVEHGGRLLVCYNMPYRLATALGFRPGNYVRQDRPGHFAEIRFEAPDIAGLPQRVHQASWNITTASPAGHNARVIGQWYDDAGKPTGNAAMLLSDRGAFFSHIVLGDDRAGKKQMLAAVLGHLAPELWPQMVDAARSRATRIGPYTTQQEIERHVRAYGDAEALRQFEAAAATLALAGRSGHEQHAALSLARQAEQMFAEAYLRSQPSPAVEGRAVWNHSGTGAYPGDWERSAKLLADNGLNMVLPNMLWGGRAHYPSDVLPRSSTYERYGDQIAQCLAAARRHGLEVHVWKVNFNLSGAPREFIERMRREGRTQVDVDGRPQDWLAPSHPDNFKLELESMLEVVRNYDVDGLHFDYIRYPNRTVDYSADARRRFEADTGVRVENWPQDCYSGPLKKQYNDWRCRQITRLVAAVSREAKKIRPDVKISAAVFGAYPDCRESVAQDWPEWIKAGYLDFVCPMDYTGSDLRFSSLVENQLRLVGGWIPVYPGIGATASHSTLSADRVVGQIHHARRLGAAGFTIFDFQPGTAGSVVPGVGLGAGAKRSTPPHAVRR